MLEYEANPKKDTTPAPIAIHATARAKSFLPPAAEAIPRFCCRATPSGIFLYTAETIRRNAIFGVDNTVHEIKI